MTTEQLAPELCHTVPQLKEAVGQHMDKLSIRLSEQEKAALRVQAEKAGVTVSELIRDRLFPRNLAGTPATFGQVEELAKRVALLSDLVNQLSGGRENGTRFVPGSGVGSASFPEPEPDFPLEKIERALSTLAQNSVELKQLFLEQMPSSFSPERERDLPETLAERLENMTKNLASLVELMTCLNEKMDQASIDEKERLKSLLFLMEAKLVAHDQAEQERFSRMRPGMV